MSEDKSTPTNTPKINNQTSNPEQKKVDMANYVTKEDHAAQLDKIRADERDKQARSLAESKEASEKLRKELDALKAQVEGKVDLPDDPEPDLGDKAVLANMLKQMQDESAARDAQRVAEQAKMAELLASYDKRFEEQAEASQKLVADAQLDAYKASLLASSDLAFPELVVGDSKEALDASLKAVKERESKIAAAAEAKANGKNVQTPVNPGTPSNQKSELKTSLEIASLPDKEYNEWKANALKEARAQA